MDTKSKQDIATKKLQNPFPGLRPFHPNEAHLFFGRDGQSEEILVNLAKNKFAAILGASGSGKSSLIYCGLLPILHGGFLHNGRSKWRIAISRPGSNPTANLALSLAETFCESNNEEDIEADSLINQAIINRSAEGISNVLNQYGVSEEENVLILVDQLEELFRYQFSGKDSDAMDKVDHFINLLVNIVKQNQLPVYVVITMRSDFIGDCSPFQQFTRLINDSHYLIPRMTRDDFRKAITGPISVAEGKVSDQLVQLLLNEMGNNPDHLPVLQHALMRTWEYWIKHSDTNFPIGITEYEAIGRLERALSNHANDAFYELTLEQKRTCEVVFKSLTEKGADNRGVRRPTSVKELATIAETSVEEVISVVEVFRQKGRTFLTPSPELPLNEESLVDISHESLMRVWDKLKIWVEDEANAVKMYLRLAESADLYSEGKANLWGPPDLQLAISWREKQKPNLAWASRYHPAFERTMVYLQTSEDEYIAEEENKIRLQKRAIRRSRIVALVLGTAAIISIGLGILALIQRQDALKESNRANEQEKIAVREAEEARIQRTIAEERQKEADAQKELAFKNQAEAEYQQGVALKNLGEADRQRNIATQREREAQEQRVRAVENEKNAIEQQKRAEQASLDAERRRMLSIAQSMAVKSQQMRADTLQKGLLAYQAFVFNQESEGVSYNPDIYKAIYLSTGFFKGENYNVYAAHTSLVRTFITSNAGLISSGSDGQIISWDLNTKSFSILQSNLPIVKKIVNLGSDILGITNRGSFVYNQANNMLSEHVFFPIDIKEVYVTSQKKILYVLNNSVNISESYNQLGVEIFKSDVRINASKYHPESNTLFLAFSSGQVKTLTLSDQSRDSERTIATISGSNWGDIGFSGKKQLLAAGFGNNQGAVYLWNYSTGQLISILRGHNAKISGIAFSSDANYLATASYDGTVRLWHLEDLNTLPIVFDDNETWITSLAFTADNKHIISGDKNGNIKMYPVDVNTLLIDYCQFLTRTLTTEEWNNYVGVDIPYKPKQCIQ
jgi:hypothetical protein